VGTGGFAPSSLVVYRNVPILFIIPPPAVDLDGIPSCPDGAYINEPDYTL
jgi:hypothetical protein